MTQDTDQAPHLPIKAQAEAAVNPIVVNVEQHLEAWLHDLLASIPLLRDTDTYNRLRAAVDDLKHRLS